MVFPLSLSDLSLWLAVMAVIVVVGSEMLYSLPEYLSSLLDKKLLRMVGVGCGLGFAVTVLMRIAQII
jgi:hypothetical protein